MLEPLPLQPHTEFKSLTMTIPWSCCNQNQCFPEAEKSSTHHQDIQCQNQLLGVKIHREMQPVIRQGVVGRNEPEVSQMLELGNNRLQLLLASTRCKNSTD